MKSGDVPTCNSFEGVCEFGLRSNPWTIQCSGGSCTEAECCQIETGEPLPVARPENAPQDATFVVISTKVSGVSYQSLASSDALAPGGALDQKFKPIMAPGVDPENVEMKYAPGSLLVAAEILVEATEDGKEPVVPTTLPSAAAVVSALSSVPAVLEAVIPGQELAAAEPVGVKFVAGSSEPQSVTTTTTTTMTSTSLQGDAPDNGEGTGAGNQNPKVPAESQSQSSDGKAPAADTTTAEGASRPSTTRRSAVVWPVLPVCFASMTLFFVH